MSDLPRQSRSPLAPEPAPTALAGADPELWAGLPPVFVSGRVVLGGRPASRWFYAYYARLFPGD